MFTAVTKPQSVVGDLHQVRDLAETVGASSRTATSCSGPKPGQRDRTQPAVELDGFGNRILSPRRRQSLARLVLPVDRDATTWGPYFRITRRAQSVRAVCVSGTTMHVAGQSSRPSESDTDTLAPPCTA